MAKAKIQAKLVSYGRYSTWDSQSKDLPDILEFTQTVEAVLDVEFGMVINIKKAKGEKLEYCINHPQISDKQGLAMAPFTGEVYVRSNDWNFFLGDTVWLPLEDKLGPWDLSLSLHGKTIAQKTITLVKARPLDLFD
ncbi:DUF3859 domain-containing protein [Alginatibacterium sediminis]|uniref:DUF3859 domain-containing protein n=1 Tax=Alginatibacterium sediminis TaxID=2164068 RepID=A0A420ECS1_9ALTE|nr:DUF3859 domain-containing protein [Alginatibacterium sediminis]RKF18463.1 DUF3859 domain-containing protein [Alginatibacterium sediminis]